MPCETAYGAQNYVHSVMIRTLVPQCAQTLSEHLAK